MQSSKLESWKKILLTIYKYILPTLYEVKELVINAHKQFYELESIGWDFVITPNGPVILEGNDDWEIGGPQDTSGGLKKRWIELTKKRI